MKLLGAKKRASAGGTPLAVVDSRELISMSNDALVRWLIAELSDNDGTITMERGTLIVLVVLLQSRVRETDVANAVRRSFIARLNESRRDMPNSEKVVPFRRKREDER